MRAGMLARPRAALPQDLVMLWCVEVRDRRHHSEADRGATDLANRNQKQADNGL